MGSLKKPRDADMSEEEYKSSEDPARMKRKWLFTGMSTVIFLLLAAAAVFIIIVSLTSYSSLRSELEHRAQTIATYFEKSAGSDYAQLCSGVKSYIAGYSDRDSMELQLLDTDGAILYSSSGIAAGTMPSTQDVVQAISNSGSGNVSVVTWRGLNRSSGESIMASTQAITFPSGETAAYIRCVSSLKTVNLRITKSAGNAAIVAIVIFVFIIIAFRFSMRYIMSPVARINETAKQIAKGRYGVHIDETYPDEMGRLCDTINEMSDAIGRSEKLKNDFISSVSHELRTPLTAIGGWSETLLSSGSNDPEEMKHGLTIIRSEASRLTRMVEEMLDFSRMESGSLTMRMEKIDIIPDIEDVVFMYMESMRREGIALEYNEEDDLPPIMGDRERLRQVFLNILDNAIKHGGEGKRISVQAGLEEGTLIISVRDYGAGIPPEELPHVKERFFKGSSHTRGSGIGLAVADEIMKLHGGRLDIDSTLGQGTTSTMVLPIIIGKPEET